MRSARNGAVTRRPDGIVLIDPEKGRGQKALLKACPYGAIWWNEEKQLPQKCTLCAHLLDEGWQTPRCVQACPTGALSIVKLDDGAMQSLIEAQGLETLGGHGNPTRPTVYYKNLYRFKQCFITGSVAVGGDGGPEECLEGAAVKLFKDGKLLEETVTDAFGDFKFDRLQARSGQYQLALSYPDKGTKQIEIELGQSVSVGTVFL